MGEPFRGEGQTYAEAQYLGKIHAEGTLLIFLKLL